ncbi:hypothetical protein A3A76_05870 [Candidatus Woesebacteria bacterium RIFCSPLOWO2_01_FULL_39_23]|uniref:GIY-YIG domain-containing protein n=1 Tax=Candidatus Woesebacteria bacterium RIFCSPHIGHO2_01_FULL_40_22 TaxID=1802499 RepID=A0A1F7YJ67_9BACT|nr:MAG: hypothetical protein A2141_02570 [Candidatus Woesebacteria bacterium RBG_16_40_11]OGM26929.1 MAG: hypothetical protein A2628_05815 [Candidatus Woesebacteria bacterium RIFCSPHIGHO2_01_FULL_40_22]OGM37338.1 MAG: hypothetical protein A3E41_04210 [Candidatus Woesebacteria bacterium RIFCSPHIGHO2_12_FULL_38_9]OGM63203.1 MAG: hypothetical protein A3A76_05870 [Candidatus Woesebacteria bacterium RIFCSPLOWO2_01_FULL_39_23]
MQYYVYILGNNRPTLYVGVTSSLAKRIYQHRNNLIKGFTSKYLIHKLLYYEVVNNPQSALGREKQLKNWHREWKLNLIKLKNPEFKDLYSEILK